MRINRFDGRARREMWNFKVRRLAGMGAMLALAGCGAAGWALSGNPLPGGILGMVAAAVGVKMFCLESGDLIWDAGMLTAVTPAGVRRRSLSVWDIVEIRVVRANRPRVGRGGVNWKPAGMTPFGVLLSRSDVYPGIQFLPKENWAYENAFGFVLEGKNWEVLSEILRKTRCPVNIPHEIYISNKDRLDAAMKAFGPGRFYVYPNSHSSR